MEPTGNVVQDAAAFSESKKHEHNHTAEVALGQLSAMSAPRHSGYGNEDEEALKWAALERLPTYDRIRTAIINKAIEDGNFVPEEVPVHEMTKEQRFELVERALEVHGQDNEVFCRKLKARLDRAGVKFPTVEVKFDKISVEAKVRVGSRALPTLSNFVQNLAESILVSFKAVPDRRKDFPILHNVSGVLKPGRMTLLLGPPGAGKSTLMKYLSGKSDKGLKQTGEVTYNGHDMTEFITTRTSSYISQQDLHLGELTVRETLDFSARLQGSGGRVDLVSELERRERELGIKPDPHMDSFMKAMAVEGQSSHIVTDLMLRILGLDVVSETLVGNEMVRGVSGGQKKRVTTGEMIVGAKQVLFMDEISTGLDSSTTFQITQCLRHFTHTQDATVLIALLQPAPETYDLFDDILLLAEGHVVFHGPREDVVSFFEAQGFKCPERKGIADFLQEVTSLKDQAQYWAVKERPYRFVPVATLSEAFEATPQGALIRNDIATPYPKEQSPPGALVTTRFALPKMELFKAVYYREAMLMKRNAFLYIALTVQMGIVSLISSAVFFRTTLHQRVDESNFYLGALFFGLVLVLFNGFAEMSLLIERLPVFYKQRDMNLFPAWTWLVPLWTLSIPFSIFACVVWVGINYYIIGFSPQAGRFFLQILIYVLLHQMGIGLFRFIGAVGRHMVIANTFGAFGIIVLFVLCGFIIAKNDIHPYWIWGFWVSPVTYVMEGLILNEFLANRWQKPANQTLFPGQTIGHVVISSRDFWRGNYMIWVGCAAVVGSIIIFNVLCILALEHLDPLGSAQPLVSEDVLEVKHAARTGQSLASVSGMSSRRSRATAGTKSRRSLAGASGLGNGGVGSPQLSALDNYLAQSMMRQPAASGHASTVDAARRSLQQRSGMGPEALKSLSGLGAQSGLGPQSATVQDSSHLKSPSGLSGKEKALQSESALSAAAAALQEAGVLGKKGMVLPFVPLALSFQHVNYFVPMPAEMKAGRAGETRLQLLRDISGAFRPGVLTALVGVSGAGKTTLMDVLAGRKTGGTIEGDIRVSGYPKVPETFARIMGYCEQFDIHSPQVTVYESLLYSALLRLPKDVDKETREEFVEEVMELVEMAPLREALVGLPGVTGLSTEQRKRLTIAVELVANPSIIFMDEPTSGLDARAAAIVMRTVRNTVDTGRTVVCTIHQPSIDIFEAFDELVLMKRGGQLIYMGPLGKNSQQLIDYFEAIPGVPKIKDGYNPATWMLEASSPATAERLGVDFAELFASSKQYKDNEAMLTELEVPPEGHEDLYFPTRYSTGFSTQFLVNLWKRQLMYWRSPEYNVVRYFFTCIMALLLGSVFFNLGQKRRAQQNVLNIMGALYTASLFIGWNNGASVQPIVFVERSVFYRERAAGYYSPIPYALAQGVIELPYVTIQTIVYSLIVYSMIHFEWTAPKFFWFTLYTYLTLLYFTYYGMMAISLSPNQQLAMVLSIFFFALWNVASGFIIPRPKMPVWVRWYAWCNPVAWTLYGLVASQLGDIKTLIHQVGITPDVSVKQYLLDYFDFEHKMLGWVVMVQLAFVVLFFLVFAFALDKLNFQKR